MKRKRGEELVKQRDFASEKVRRVEEELKDKLRVLSDQLNDALMAKHELEAELIRLRESKDRAEKDFE